MLDFGCMQILLVGGAVRNLLLGRPSADKDFLVNGISREEFLRRFPQAREVGHSFPVFLINGEEYSFPRADSLENDLLERDFTVNALALTESGELLAHPRGLEDLHRRILRPASEKVFDVDPLRVFRAARLLAELSDFTAAPELLELMRRASVNGSTDHVAAERVGRETLRALGSERPSNFIETLCKTQNLMPWFKELEPAGTVPAGPLPHHNESVLEHTGAVLDLLAGEPAHPSIRRLWMGLVHDIGKCATPRKEWPRHIGHEHRGPILARKLALRLRLPGVLVKAGEIAARLHMKAGRYGQLRPGTKVDLLQALAHADMIQDLFAVSAADRSGPNHAKTALCDFHAMRAVTLPEEYRNRGEESGKMLRQLRAQVLIRER